jgi:PAS domain S-box-containing protein
MKVIAWNRAMEEMTGVAKEDMLGKGDHAYTVPFYGEKRQQLIDLLDIDDAELKNKYSNITRKGRTLYAETASPALYGGKGAYVWAIGAPLYDMEGKRIGAIESIRDITEKKIAEELRNNDLALIESLLLNSPAGIRVFDAETGQCILVNQSASDIAGGPREALLEQNFRFLESWKVSGLLTLAEQVLADGVPRSTETVLHTSFEKEVPVTYQMSRFIVRERQNLLVIGRDISEERRLGAEKKQIEEQMLHAQKLESMGVLAGGIAHDFNNILTAIIGNADLALMRLNPESPVLENLQRIEKAAGRASELAKQMLAYSGKGRFVIESIDLNRLVEEMLHMLEVSISKNAVLRLNLHKPLPTVEADATQMRQVIMNLVINASEAISEKSGVIAITSGCMECDRNYLKDVWLDENLTDGLYVYLEIADSGCGMNKETMGKIFDPFFTTKFTGRGLGMAAVLGIIRGHKGAIKVYSEPGKGSSFKILLPASSKPEEIFNAKSDNDSWKGSGTVLLVDDEETIRALGSEMLREIGFQVVTAEDGRHALEIFNSRDDISFVILDLTMPHMDGEQTFRELRRLKPDIKVIMSSGYNEQEVTQKFVGKGLAGFIQKPYKLSMIRDVIYKLSI